MANRQFDIEYYKTAMLFCKTKRERLRLGQKEVAADLRISEEHYRRFENGQRVPKHGDFEHILEILKITPAELDDYLRQQGISTSHPVSVDPERADDSHDAHGNDLDRERLEKLEAEIKQESIVDRERQAPRPATYRWSHTRVITVTVLVILLVLGGFMAILTHQKSDEQQIRDLLSEANNFESLTLYENPQSFEKSQIDRYWVPNGPAATEVEKSVLCLIKRGLYYGKESRREHFDIRSVKIGSNAEGAEVTVSENWYLPVYNTSGEHILEHNPTLGTKYIKYVLHKINGQWLIYSSTTEYIGCFLNKSRAYCGATYQYLIRSISSSVAFCPRRS